MGSDYSTFPTVSNYYTSMPTRSYNGSSKESCVRSFHTTYDWNKHLDNIKGSCQLMVIDFTASWCGPCKAIEPAFMELAAKFTDVIFVKIDVDELMSVAGEFGVEAMPTFCTDQTW
ncbi:hypothetical protein IFM89_005417 [Coptis chinensis]|uniref:Thioredoxin domain-containing protein n=1 Tax=Coptis chinensis TaxID=261450 RepID=A0A835IW97_9MAGN|nr:hypothetical protein IFM89_005417 [Coptis chinensis]